MNEDEKLNSAILRFEKYLDKTSINGCWLWTGGVSNRGAPRFCVSHNYDIPAQKFAWELQHGPIIDEDVIIKCICGNKLCVNPNHLRMSTPEIRFWNYVDRSNPDSCWNWQGPIGFNGYGTSTMRGKIDYAHRVMYQYIYGKIPKGMFVCHTCDNPRCCNPAHLFLGTPKENSYDMIARGRNAFGSKHGQAILNENDIPEIVLLHKNGTKSRLIAKRYGVSEQCISNIVNGWGWKRITGSTRTSGVAKEY